MPIMFRMFLLLVMLGFALFLYVNVKRKHKEFKEKEQQVKDKVIIDYDHTLWDDVFITIENNAKKFNPRL